MSKSWVDKYRPQSLNHVILPDDIRTQFDTLIAAKDMPHLLISGPPGCGKSSTAIALCRNKFGSKLSERLTELNASDKRGINVVRTTIKHIASKAIGAPDPTHPCPAYRIIMLDEMDAMTSDAQSALRKIMEDYSKNTRFILLCNYAHQISEPIRSRCPLIQFKPVTHANMVKRLRSIAHRESLEIADDVLATIAELSDGDMRVAITTLQNTTTLRAIGKELTTRSVLAMVGLMTPKSVRSMILSITDLQSAQAIARTIQDDALPIHMFLQVLAELVIEDDASIDKPYTDMLLCISTAEAELGRGASAYLQLLHLLILYWQRYRSGHELLITTQAPSPPSKTEHRSASTTKKKKNGCASK